MASQGSPRVHDRSRHRRRRRRPTTDGNNTNLDAAIESLLNVEKQMRLDADVAGTRKAAIDIAELCYKAGAWKTLNDRIMLLSKRRGQLKQAITAMTLSSVSAGKIYVEIERARLIKRLAKIKEERGQIDEAADLMQEVVVETFGSMAKTKKYHSFWSRSDCAWIVKIMYGERFYPGKSVLG
ncbi:hypothetical protein GUJ93_ZPchr0007g5715 [Zizania palustris]|uniref:PSMD12/CSN4-like N-terminal domain-containing protein n=1 Tax=Zizania palustris TaxID=103762 RepID=A0A8J5W6H7_ZIZPA|nr:hypothetical protein GUJ93_ZPchr0007g5715 [Zizania palustris]